MLLPHTHRSPRVILAVVLLAQFSTPLPVFSLGALAPLLRDALHLSREQFGTLTALFYAGTAAACVPAGWGADRLGVRSLLMTAQGVGGLLLLALPFLDSFSAFRLVMVLTGVVYGTITVITTKAVAEWFSPAHRATAIGAKYVAMASAGMAAGAGVPTLALWLGWRHGFAVIGGLMLASALGALLLYYDHPAEGSGAASQPTRASHRALMVNSNFWRLAAVGFLFGGAQYTFTAYLPLFLQERQGFSFVVAASLLAQAQAVSAPSRLGYGWVSDRWLQGERKPLLYGMNMVALGALVLLLLVPPGHASLVLSLGILLYGSTGLSWGGTYQTLTAELAGRTSAGLGVGLTVSLVYAGSTVTAPLFGYLADVTGSYTVSWSMLMLWLLLGLGLLRGVRIASDAPARGIHIPLPAHTRQLSEPQQAS